MLSRSARGGGEGTVALKPPDAIFGFGPMSEAGRPGDVGPRNVQSRYRRTVGPECSTCSELIRKCTPLGGEGGACRISAHCPGASVLVVFPPFCSGQFYRGRLVLRASGPRRENFLVERVRIHVHSELFKF